MATRTDSWRGGGTGRGAYTLVANSASQVPLTIQTASGQTANALLIENSAGTDLLTVDNSGNLTIAGTVTVSVNEAVTGDSTLTGNLTVNGNSTLGDVSGDTLTVNATATFAAASTFSSSLTANGDVTLGNASTDTLTVNATPTFAAAATFSGAVTVAGLTTTNTLSVTSTATFGGNVNVTGTLALGTGRFSDGTAAVPSISFSSDTDIGMYRAAADQLGFAVGGAVELTLNATNLSPGANDGLAIGISGTAFADLFLASGAVIDFNAGAETITHSANTLTFGGITLFDMATGIFEMNDAVRFDTGVAIVAASYSIGRDADGTNQLHFNIPTGASFEFSVNDAVEMTLSASAVNFQNNTITTTGGGSLTGTWSDLGIVTTVDINGGTLDGVTIGGASAAAATVTTLTGSTAGNVLTITNTTDAASVQVGIIQGDRATIADGDAAYLTFRLSDSAGTQDEGARITWQATTVLSGATQDTDLIFAALVNNVLTTMLTLDGSANEIVPAVAINSAAAITGTAITGTSFVIGANTLTTTEWAFLDGQDQSVFTTSSPTFANLTITSFAANWTNASRTVADLGIVTTVDINGGTIDGTTIGGAAAGAITGTTFTVNTSLTVGNDASIRRDVNAGITASTTQTQGQGALTAEVNEVSVCANVNDTVTLPTAVVGLTVVVINNGAQTLRIFPASADNLGAGVDTATTLASGSNVVYQAYDITNWESI